MELLAHNGGVDEIALVLGPIALLAAALWLANRRATRLEAEAKARVAAEAEAEAATDRAAEAEVSGDR
jgi:hypothetical protein